jgi:hypothetical protein
MGRMTAWVVGHGFFLDLFLLQRFTLIWLALILLFLPAQIVDRHESQKQG